MDFYEAMKHRRSRYALSSESPISDDRIMEVVGDCLKYTPSAWHMESARVVALFGESHRKLWGIVMETLRSHVPADTFAPTEAKVNGFAAGHATLLFYEDQDTVEAMRKQFPSYADTFPLWSLQASGMVQYSVWTALSSEGLGVNIQHYNPLIDEQVAQVFDVPSSWKLWSQMVIGSPLSEPAELAYKPIEDRLIIGK
jgi:predicted oxidoreductase (fatty acid repression mutant protein)